MLCKGAPCSWFELPVRLPFSFLGSCPGCVEAGEAGGSTTLLKRTLVLFCQYILNETPWRLEVIIKTYSQLYSIARNFQKNLYQHFGLC